MNFKSQVLFFTLLLSSFFLGACSKELEYSERQQIAQNFMNAMAENRVQDAISLAMPTPEHAMAVKLMADAIALKIQTESIKEFRYVYVSDSNDGPNNAKAVFSQVIDGRISTENVILEMQYQPQTSKWLIHNMILR
ncbi:hypothetical protein [Limnobacter sp.]|uniref:hypothetical protein n=1 Tax=Limnobacter sp. TaxID=2003368 RepID=UPI003517E1B9